MLIGMLEGSVESVVSKERNTWDMLVDILRSMERELKETTERTRRLQRRIDELEAQLSK